MINKILEHIKNKTEFTIFKIDKKLFDIENIIHTGFNSKMILKLFLNIKNNKIENVIINKIIENPDKIIYYGDCEDIVLLSNNIMIYINDDILDNNIIEIVKICNNEYLHSNEYYFIKLTVAFYVKYPNFSTKYFNLKMNQKLLL